MFKILDGDAGYIGDEDEVLKSWDFVEFNTDFIKTKNIMSSVLSYLKTIGLTVGIQSVKNMCGIVDAGWIQLLMIIVCYIFNRFQ